MTAVVGRYVSVALSLRLPSLDIIQHSALWSSDFPRTLRPAIACFPQTYPASVAHLRSLIKRCAFAQNALQCRYHIENREFEDRLCPQVGRFVLRRSPVAPAEHRKWVLRPWRRFCVHLHTRLLHLICWWGCMLSMMQQSIVSTTSRQ